MPHTLKVHPLLNLCLDLTSLLGKFFVFHCPPLLHLLSKLTDLVPLLADLFHVHLPFPLQLLSKLSELLSPLADLLHLLSKFPLFQTPSPLQLLSKPHDLFSSPTTLLHFHTTLLFQPLSNLLNLVPPPDKLFLLLPHLLLTMSYLAQLPCKLFPSCHRSSLCLLLFPLSNIDSLAHFVLSNKNTISLHGSLNHKVYPLHLNLSHLLISSLQLCNVFLCHQIFPLQRLLSLNKSRLSLLYLVDPPLQLLPA
mmetsp:Transcript_18408/g.30254  ORF Transcript_18408/g.30254 Transcript_18408/m.30254 type:complete len:251 (-) Transcript_18408:818-1570(-)